MHKLTSFGLTENLTRVLNNEIHSPAALNNLIEPPTGLQRQRTGKRKASFFMSLYNRPIFYPNRSPIGRLHPLLHGVLLSANIYFQSQHKFVWLQRLEETKHKYLVTLLKQIFQVSGFTFSLSELHKYDVRFAQLCTDVAGRNVPQSDTFYFKR